MPRGDWTSILLGALSGGAAGASQGLQQQGARRRAEDEQQWRLGEPARQMDQFRQQADYTQGLADTRTATQDAKNQSKMTTLAQHWSRASQGDPDAQAAIVAVAPELASRFEAPTKAPDPYGGRSREQWLIDKKAEADAGYHPPKADATNLITAPDPNDPSRLIRVPDAEGQEVPGPSSGTSMGAASMRKLVASNKGQLSVIDDALKELNAYPGAVGGSRALGDIVPALGGVSDYVNQRVDPEGVSARAQIANVGSLVIHDRSGAAVTLSEFPRLAPFVPRQGDTPQVVRDKMAKLRENLERETGFLEAGMVPSGRGTAPPSPNLGPKVGTAGQAVKPTISKMEAAQLRAMGASQAAIDAKYTIRP